MRIVSAHRSEPSSRWAVICLLVGLAAGPIGRAASGAAEPPHIAFASVPGGTDQAGGPIYDYRISRFEIRNDEFAAFLNDALENLANERGSYLYFDVGSGDVFVHSQETGVSGTSGLGTVVFDADVNGYLRFDGARFVVVDPLFADHPVTGVTWFGALKFCNWLTVSSGLSPDERAYGEGPTSEPDRWRPITISPAAWGTRDLNDPERAALVLKRGFRLPMDGGVDGVHPHGEWYKAASARRDANGAVFFDAPFGYGRLESPGPGDANFIGSGDTFEPGTTPVGYFDGVQRLGDQTVTRDTNNAFGLHDLSGNVWEWMQDQSPTDPTRRRNRGGSWISSPASLRNDPGATRSAATAVNTTGFRIVQSVLERLLVTPQTEIHVSGPWGGPLDAPLANGIELRLANLTDDSIGFSIAADQTWLSVTPASGSIQGHDWVDVTAILAADCSQPLAVGEHATTVRVDHSPVPNVVERTVRWAVREPLEVTPSEAIAFQMVYGGRVELPHVDFEIASESDAAVRWAATWSKTSSPSSGVAWLVLDGQSSASGEVGPQGVALLSVAVHEGAVGALPVGLHSAEVTLTDECTGATFTRNVSLTIAPPFTATPLTEAAFDGPFGGPFAPTSQVLTVSNPTTQSVTWTAETCVDPAACTGEQQVEWVELDGVGGVLSPGASTSLTMNLTAAANGLAVGTYHATIRLRDPVSGYELDRPLVLHVAGLAVEPDADLLFAGPRGGPFSPARITLTLTNPGMPELHWTAEALPSSGNGPLWFEVLPTKGTILDPGETDSVAVTLSSQAFALETGEYLGEVRFTSLKMSLVRTVRLTVASEQFSLDMVNVPVEEGAADGPQYFFRFGRFEVTNAEYARFLNDCLRHKGDARGQYMFHDVDSGSVFINNALDGEEGNAAPNEVLSTRLYEAELGRIHFHSDQPEPYQADIGYTDHPVVGVSWYGAAKFCDWLTLLQGMSAAEQCYGEGPSAAEWTAMDFDPSSPLTNRHGFRLPRDGQSVGSGSSNEWYKAASLGTNRPSDAFARFGFGRDTLTAADANYLASGDTVGETTTPVGLFDGIHFLADGRTHTADTDNGYGIYDLCGNVAEWTHEINSTTSVPQGAVRGGHFLQPPNSEALRNTSREPLAADSAQSFVGFRVAQSLSPVPFAVIQSLSEVHADGFVGGPFSQTSFILRLQNDAPYTVDNLSISIDTDWLVVDGPAPQQIPPHSVMELPLRLAEAASLLRLSPPPLGQMVMVPALDEQEEGPEYDFWISTTEVTNDQFITFLNDARAHPNDGRGSYMYFDSDSGNVYLNDDPTGRDGTGPPAAATPIRFYDAGLGRIQLTSDRYVAESGFGRHPVVGVSWFGAVKYCNWLTLYAGLPAGVRAYSEGLSPDDWHPVTVTTSDWSLRGISDAERQLLIDNAIGYRLPMDDETSGPAAFNEWYKAASARTEDGGSAAFNAVFGFGRDQLWPQDANYYSSGDTAVESTTVASFFDGANLLLDGITTTLPTANRYGLYDLTGNVAEWTQDFYATGNSSARSLRGGGWRHHAASVELTNSRRISLAPSAAASFVGFRVVRGTGHIATIEVYDALSERTESRHIILDLLEPLQLNPDDGMVMTGTFCEDFSDRARTYTLSNESHKPMPWSARIEPEVDWLSINDIGSGPVTGELLPGPDGLESVTVATTFQADLLPPGSYAADVVVTNTRTSNRLVRPIRLRIDSPLEVQPDGDNPDSELHAVWQGEVDALGEFHFSLLRSPSTSEYCDVRYRVSSSATWLTITPRSSGAGLEGTVPGLPDELRFAATINEGARNLPVGTHPAAIEFTLVRPELSTPPQPILHEIQLHIDDPLRIEQDAEPWVICCGLSGEPWPTQTYTLHNDHASSAIVVSVEADTDWVDLTSAQLSIAPQDSAALQVSLNDEALAPHGDYTTTVRFIDSLTGESQTRTIVLQIREQLSVTPVGHFRASGRSGGPFHPAYTVYTLRNIAAESLDPIEWRAFTDQAWATFGGASAAGGTLMASQSFQLVMSIDAATVPAVPAGLSELALPCAVTIEDLTHDESVTRSVLLTVVNPHLTVEETAVSPSSSQPGGPAYAYLMGTFPVTNAEFAAFLNDASANLESARGEYLYFDTSNGDVFLNSQTVGEIGVGAGGRSHKLFSPSISGQIAFAENRYTVVAVPLDYSSHPVAGVSWYGALKYCNWLTLDRGWLPEERCYTEDGDSNPGGWRPVALSQTDWGSRDLNDGERSELVSDCRGYRLPMDDGYYNATASLDLADEYNEWHKAAAWNDALRQNSLFGFGRNTLTGVDANFRCSGDPFEDSLQCDSGSTTPVGYFDGTIKDGGFVTNADANGFGLFDMTGNVHQWLQDRYAPPASLDRRTLRGGSWNDPVQSESFRNSSRVLFAAPDTLSRQIGFRVVRVPAIPTGDFDADGSLTLADWTAQTTCFAGPGGQPTPWCAAFDFDQDGDVDLSDYSQFLSRFSIP